MAYDHTQYEVMVAKDVDLNSAADCGDWAPGYLPHIVRAAAIVVTNTIGNETIVKGDKRPTAGDDTSRGDGDVFSITVPNTTAAGAVIYQDGLDVEIKPGEEVVAEVTDAGASGDTGHVILLLEPRWDVPGNESDMTATA